MMTKKRPNASVRSYAGRRMKFDGRWCLKSAAVWYYFTMSGKE
jgi:hypothetical protein